MVNFFLVCCVEQCSTTDRLGPNASTPQDTLDKISAALETSFVFKGIDKNILHEVVCRMFPVKIMAGAIVLEQDALPNKDDCLYYLEEGEVDIVISGNADQKSNEEERKVEGNIVRIHKHPGWVFGDVALLFNSPRSASVVAKTNITLWAMDRRTFLKVWKGFFLSLVKTLVCNKLFIFVNHPTSIPIVRNEARAWSTCPEIC